MVLRSFVSNFRLQRVIAIPAEKGNCILQKNMNPPTPSDFVWSPIPNVPILNLAPPAPTNYIFWSQRMIEYLVGEGLWEAIEPKSVPKDSEAWRIKNKMALDAIRMTCDPPTLSMIYDISSAKMAWNTMAKMFELQTQGVNLADLSRIALFGVNFGDLSGLTKPPLVRMIPFGAVWHFDVDNKRFAAMYAAIYKGNWANLKMLLDANPTALTAKVSGRGQMLIHVAANTGNEEITQQLAKLMNITDLQVQDSYGATALTYAAYNGMTRTVECLLSLNDQLHLIANRLDLLPVIDAAQGTHHETTRYLYSRTPIACFYPQNGNNGSTLLCACFVSGIFDVALDLIRRCPSLTISPGFGNTSPFLVLGSRASEFHGSSLTFWKRWIYSFLWAEAAATAVFLLNRLPTKALEERTAYEVYTVLLHCLSTLKPFLSSNFHFPPLNFRVKQIYELKLMHAYALEILRCMCHRISFIKDTELPTGVVENGLTEAVKNGIFEFVVEIIKACPHRMYYADIFGRDMIMEAVSYRQEKVYSLIYGLKVENTGWISRVDYFGNNMLHLAGMLAPPSRLAKISGAALQMQRELQWFKEVESIVLPYQKDMQNMDGETPEQLFEKSHKQLMVDGEKWMKETATSSTVVGALIITIMFAAIFTVPTSTVLENNKPSFSYKKTYMVFVISDSISLFASSTSVLMFLGILTSRYAQEDFLKSLPTKLIIGLSALFFSIVSMMISFCSTLMIMLEGQLHLVIPIILLVSIPVTLFIFLQFPLLVEIFIYTYGPGIFNKNMKSWY
ncbi:hypothetical protein K2173_024174 [Erythroxylum novogranatense]|uniref:PGG domain-containing protein n=1 Tax=Erythroxylum novogranatense TaxID=1862640 RepID=A0AAV8UEU7_9ROSI|nr:hypothetical protein K2173_024174 [Erythroxylum novogranatense]